MRHDFLKLAEADDVYDFNHYGPLHHMAQTHNVLSVCISQQRKLAVKKLQDRNCGTDIVERPNEIEDQDLAFWPPAKTPTNRKASDRAWQPGLWTSTE